MTATSGGILRRWIMVRGREDPVTRLQWGSAWSLLATVFSQGATFLTNIILANMLGRSRFGEYALVLATMQFIAGIGGLGTGYAGTRYLAEYAQKDRTRAGRTAALLLLLGVGSAALIGVTIAALGGVIAQRILGAPQLTLAVRTAGFAAAVAAANGTLIGCLAGLERFGSVARAAVLAGILYIAGAVTGAQLAGVPGAIAGIMLAGLMQFSVLVPLLWRAFAAARIYPSLVGCWHQRHILTRWVAPGVVSGFTALGALWFAQTFLARQVDGLTSLGGYVAAYNLMALGLLLPNVMNNVAMAVINALRGQGEGSAYREFFFINLRHTAAAQIVAIIVLTVAAERLLRLYGVDFGPSKVVLYILLAASLPEAFTIALNQVIQSNEQIWRTLTWVNLPRDSVLVAGAILLSPIYGAAGLAMAYAAARIIGFTGTFLLARQLGLRLSRAMDDKDVQPLPASFLNPGPS